MEQVQFTLINNSTGEYKEFTEKDGLRYSTEPSRKKINKYYDRKRSNAMFRAYNSDLGGFIFAVYEMGKEFNKHEEVLAQADLTRLIFIGTYTNFDGVLMENQKTVMSKKKLQELTGLSRNKFTEFYNKLLQLGILLEQEGRILMNEAYFFKGNIKDHEASVEDSCTRIYIETVKDLYNSTSTNAHKVLGILFRVIPYLNIEYNVVCHNPAERIADYVKPMTLGELAERLGYSSQNIGKFKRDLQGIKTKDGKQVIVFASCNEDKRTFKVVVNPKVIYGGNDFEKVEALTILFK